MPTGTANQGYTRAVTQNLQALLDGGGFYCNYQGVHIIGESRESVDRVCRSWSQTNNSGISGQGNNQGGDGSDNPQTTGQKQRKPMSAEARARMAAAARKRAAAQRKEAGRETQAQQQPAPKAKAGGA